MNILCRFGIHDWDKWIHTDNVPLKEIPYWDDLPLDMLAKEYIGSKSVRYCKRCNTRDMVLRK